MVEIRDINTEIKIEVRDGAVVEKKKQNKEIAFPDSTKKHNGDRDHFIGRVLEGG